MDAIIAAFLKEIIFDPTAEPKTLDASLAPRDQPRKSPLVKKNKIILLIACCKLQVTSYKTCNLQPATCNVKLLT
jgi:hypothetical protein